MDAVVTSPPELKAESPLLPSVLLGPAAFLWLWALPIGVLLLLNFQAWWLIEGNLSASQRHDALLLGVGNLVNLLVGVATYLAATWQKKKGADGFNRQPWWGVPPLVVQIAFLWWVLAWTDRVLPRSVTAWIYPEDRHLFNHFAFAMLPLFLGLLRIAGARSPKNIGPSIALNLACAIGGPVVLYFFIVVLASFTNLGKLREIIFATALVGCGVLMFIGIVRGLMLVLRNVRRWGDLGERIAIALFAVLLPVGGLLLNRFIPFPVDFQAWEIYALVIVNAAILLFASFQRAEKPRLSFYLLSASFPFSLYFFIVFLPYIPLSILAVIVMGAGFLVLAPIFLFVLHLYSLHQARRDPAIQGSRLRVTLTGILCALLLPAFFTGRALADKAALNAALDHVYAPDISAENLTYQANLTNLRRALSSHRSYKNGIYYPLLSDFYGWLVFDNLVLPDDKLDRLEKTFFGAAGSRLNTDPMREGLNPWGGHQRSVRERSRMPRAAAVPHTVSVSQVQVKNVSAAGGDVVTTFTLTLQNNGSAPAEFLQTLPLPSGVFVSGFRLHIDGQSVPGRIFEKKTALWVYTMVRDSERRDPGLLYYLTREELELRVFPVNANASTVVEIDFIHPATAEAPDYPSPANDLSAHLVALGRALRPHVTGDHHELALSGLRAEDFPAVEREPYLHLIIDRSLDNPYTADLSWMMATLREKFPHTRLGRVTLTNHDVVDLAPHLLPLDELAKKVSADSLENLPASGGFALDLCLARAIRQHREQELDRYAEKTNVIPVRPIFVVLSGKAAARALDLGLTESWRDLLPGLELCEFGSDGSFQSHLQSAASRPLLRIGHAVRSLVTHQPVRFPGADSTAPFYWSPQTSSWVPVPNAKLQNGNAWSRAVALHLQEQDHARAPGGDGLDRKALVAASRDAGILIPATSYIVVENQAQWRMLELSERQKLEQNDALAFRETPAPSAVWLGPGLILWLGFRRWRSARLQPCGGEGTPPTRPISAPRPQKYLTPCRSFPTQSQSGACFLSAPRALPLRPPRPSQAPIARPPSRHPASASTRDHRRLVRAFPATRATRALARGRQPRG
jgi:hypothetical protein